jgi:hypothetical protein
MNPRKIWAYAQGGRGGFGLKIRRAAIFGSGRISEPKISAALSKIHRGFIATG